MPSPANGTVAATIQWAVRLVLGLLLLGMAWLHTTQGRTDDRCRASEIEIGQLQTTATDTQRQQDRQEKWNRRIEVKIDQLLERAR